MLPILYQYDHTECVLTANVTCGNRQVVAQKEVMAEQSERVRDLEAGTRQLEERCAELKDAAAGHEERARAASSEVLKGNRIIEKLMVRLKPSNAVSRRSAQCESRIPPALFSLLHSPSASLHSCARSLEHTCAFADYTCNTSKSKPHLYSMSLHIPTSCRSPGVHWSYTEAGCLYLAPSQ